MADWRTSGPDGGPPVSNCDPRDSTLLAREMLEDAQQEILEKRAFHRAWERDCARLRAEMPRVVRKDMRAKKKEASAANRQLAEDPPQDVQDREVAPENDDKKRTIECSGKGSSLSGSWIFSRLRRSQDSSSCDSSARDRRLSEANTEPGDLDRDLEGFEIDIDEAIASTGARRNERIIKSRRLSSRLKRGFQVIFGLDKPKPLEQDLSIYLGHGYCREKGTMRDLVFTDTESEATSEAMSEAPAEDKERDDCDIYIWRPALASQPLKPV